MDISRQSTGKLHPIFIHHLSDHKDASVFEVGEVMVALMPCEKINDGGLVYDIKVSESADAFDTHLVDLALRINPEDSYQVEGRARTPYGDKAVREIIARKHRREKIASDAM